MPIVFIVAAVISQAISHGLITVFYDNFDSLLFSTLSFFLASIVFMTLTLLRQTRRAASSKETLAGFTSRSVRLVGYMNVLTAITFLSFYASLESIAASISASIEVAIGPMGALLIGALTGLGRGARMDYLVAGVLLSLSIALAIVGTDHSEGIGASSYLLGCALALVAGVGAASIGLLSRKLGEINVSPMLVTAHRFHLTYIIGVILLFGRGGGNIDWSLLDTNYLALCIAGVVVPLYLLQIGLQRADTVLAMTLITASPSLTYLCEVLFGGAYNLWSLLLVNAIVAISIGYVIRSTWKARNAQRAAVSAAHCR